MSGPAPTEPPAGPPVRRRAVLTGAAAAAVAAAGASRAAAAPADHPGGPPRPRVGTWATGPTAVPTSAVTHFEDQTLRQVVHASIGGGAIQVRLSNEFGPTALHVGEVRIAHRAGRAGTDIDPRSDRPVTFGGRTATDVASGAPALSDPVDLEVAPGGDLVVSLYLPARTAVTTVHNAAFQTNVVADGNVTAEASVSPVDEPGQWYFLSGVSVAGERRASAVAAIGDSITNGAFTETNANHRWPDLLAERLRAARGVGDRGVLNLGIGGNRLLHDPNPPPGSDAEDYAAFFGDSALRRFDRDVIAQPGVSHVITLIGVNDLGHPGHAAPESEAVTAEQLIDGHRQLIARAHAAGLSIFGGTMLGFKDAGAALWNPENAAKRSALNDWIRSSGGYDAVIDFDAATRDPADPDRLRTEFDSGDGLHPNDAGMAAMADAVELHLLR